MKKFVMNSLGIMRELEEDNGIDLRDYFASKYISNVGIPLNNEGFLENARFAYKWADAMMKAREE